MKKGIIILLVVLYSIIPATQAKNRSYASNPAKNVNYSTAYSLPNGIGMNAKRLGSIDSIVKEGIKLKVFPGCQVFVMKNGKPVYDKCFGNYTYETSQNVKPTTMYDLASLSKTTGTLLAIMKLYDDGKLKLTDRASRYIPILQGSDKEDITIKELLFHESGLPASLLCYELAFASAKDTTHSIRIGNALYKKEWVSKEPSAKYSLQVADSFYLDKRFHDEAMQKLIHLRLRSKTYLYSCINFILLKEIVENINGMPMDIFLDKTFYAPMKLKNITYLPLQTHKKEDIAPTLKKDFLRNGVLQGYVHDPDAAFFGGVSGNAGLFASARDVAAVYQMLLNKGELNGKRYLSAETCRIFTTTTSASGRRGLGFDKPVPIYPKNSPCCISAPYVVYGHTGYTGTCCWADPLNNLVYVFLSNRTYPNDGVNKLAKMGLRTKIQEVIYQSMK